jgi:hypothetical protein
MEDNRIERLKQMSPSTGIALLLAAAMAAHAANPPAGRAADESVEVAAVFLDAAAVHQAAGSDFNNAYTVIEVTVTPKGDKPFSVQPDDFLLRINSNSDSSGPMGASQVYGAGTALVLHSSKETIGITPTDPGYSGATITQGSASVSKEEIDALQSKMLPAQKTSGPVSGLLFFPIAKKKAKDLDLVYATPNGKLHIAFR